MSRAIRISKEEAIAKGLIDPSLLDLVARRDARAAVKASSLPAGMMPEKKPKKKRKASKPAIHPHAKSGPAGTGALEFGPDGLVHAANFIFDVVPVPKERPRVVKTENSDKTFGYTPARTKHFTSQIHRVIEKVFKKNAPITGPVRLDLTFVMETPKSWAKWRKAAALDGVIAPTGRPDMDNLEKALLDGFNEKLIVDDAYVVERLARKIYGEVPKIVVRVEKTAQADINAKHDEVRALLNLREIVPQA